jgi:hypothetical protein
MLGNKACEVFEVSAELARECRTISPAHREKKATYAFPMIGVALGFPREPAGWIEGI